MEFAPVSEKRHGILLIDARARGYFKSLAASLPNCKIILMPDHGAASEFFFHHPVVLVLLERTERRSCIEMLQFFKSVKPFIPVVVMTSHGSEDLAVDMFRNGARDYFKKPLPMDELRRSIKDILGIREASNKKSSKLHTDGLHRGVRYIQEYYNTKVKLTQVAREAGMSDFSTKRLPGRR
jgi:DNA-binding NtrC family response regulator